MYPLSVLLKSPVAERKNAAESLMNTLREHSSNLVEEALMVSSELIRVAILWLETWHEGLEDASRLYFAEGNVKGMLDILLPLHEKVEAGAETPLENEFLQNFGQDLAQAHLHIKDYVRLVTEDGLTIPTGPASNQNRPSRHSEEAESAMNRAWDHYYTVRDINDCCGFFVIILASSPATVTHTILLFSKLTEQFFRRVNKQLTFTTLELSQCSPALSGARNLQLGKPLCRMLLRLFYSATFKKKHILSQSFNCFANARCTGLI